MSQPSHSRSRSDEQSDRGRVPGRFIVGGLAVALLLVVLALVFGTSASQDPDTGAQSLAAGPQPTATAIAPPPEPTAVSVASIGAKGPLEPLGLDATGKMLTPPLKEPMRASWYTGGPRPGAVGPAAILGHINGDGRPGVFEKLPKVKKGDTVEVAVADHSVLVFTVDRTIITPKTRFPDDVFTDVARPELRLISCTGALDETGHNYDSNVVVYAHLTGTHPA